jgi:TPR repeat protein
VAGSHYPARLAAGRLAQTPRPMRMATGRVACSTLILCLLIGNAGASALSSRSRNGEQDQERSVVSDSNGDTAEKAELRRLAQSAERGDRNAQFAIGLIYSSGKGVLQDEVEGVRWFRKAADQGVTAAQFSMGMAYALGRGVAQGDDEAFAWFQKAAEKGLARAQYMVGNAYMAGRGVRHDSFQGMQWYRTAAEQDFAPAQFALGVTYHPSAGPEIDAIGAIALIRKAAVQGYPPAQLRFGQLLVKGTDNPLADPDTNVVRDYIEAYMWLDVCARQFPSDDDLRLDSWMPWGVSGTSTSCSSARNQLYEMMSPEQLAEAQRQAFEWLSAHEQR